MTDSTGNYRWTAFLCLYSPWEGWKMAEKHNFQIIWSDFFKNFMMLVWLREPLEENLILVKHNRRNFSTSTSWDFFFVFTEAQNWVNYSYRHNFSSLSWNSANFQNNMRTNYQSISKSLKTFLYDFNQNCLLKHRILFFTSSYFAFRNFFFNLLPNQNYIIANACIVLYFRALQSSSADKFNWLDFCPVSVLCPPCSHGLSFSLLYKGKKTKLQGRVHLWQK